MFKEKEDNKITIERERERERERVKIRRFKYFLFTAFVISAILAFSPSLVSAYGESSPSRSILASIGSFFKGLVFSSDNQSDNQNENDSNVIAYDRAEFEKQLQQQKQDIEEALTAAKRAETKYNFLKSELDNIKASGLKIEGRTTENKTIEKTVEKIVSGLSQNDLDSGIASVRAELNNLNTNLTNQLNTLSASSNRQTSAVYQAVSLTNKIDSLSGTRLSNITVSGVTGLTDSDIPDTITASNYLPLAGGTLTGNLLMPASAYLNFGTDSGSSGYGVRDNGGTIQVKNSAGSWSNIPTSGITQWTTTGDNIYYTSGNIGIGTTSPNWKLSVAGIGSFDNYVRASYFTATSTTASTFPYASTTAITATTASTTNLIVSNNSTLGTVVGGAWQGTAIGDGYLTKSGDWTGTLDGQEGSYYLNASNLANFGNPFYTFFSATNTSALTEGSNLYFTNNRVASVIAGTTTDALTQGSTNKYWSNTLFDNRLSATTSLPNLTTLLGLTNATSTNLTSANSWLGTIRSGTWQGTAIGDTYLTKSGDWTGTLDTYNGSDLLARANHTGTQGVSTLSNYDWTFSNNYGVVNLTGSSTKPIWAQGGLNASSTSNFVYASTTALTISGNSYLGTVSSGVWNGTAITDPYISSATAWNNKWDLASSTIPVNKGGTGLTSGYNNTNWDTAYTNRITSATYPLSISSNNMSLAFGTTTSNTWAGTQTFGNASTTQIGSTGSAYFATGGGNVGIGTTAPSVLLHLNNTGSNPSQIYLESTATGYNNIMFREAGALTSFIQHVNSNYTNVSERNLLEIDNRAAGGAIAFHVGGAEKLRLANNGNVGIGTTSPVDKLEIVGGDVRIIDNGGNATLKIGDTMSNSDDSGDYARLAWDSIGDRFSIGTWDGGLNTFVLNKSGNVGIGTTTPGAKLDVSGTGNINVSIDATGGNGAGIYFKSSGRDTWHVGNSIAVASRLDVTDISTGNTGVYISSGATSWTSNSDIRLKTNITNISNALERLNRIRGVNFNWIDPNANSGAQIGVIAQEIESVFPEIVDTQGEYWGVQYEKLTPILIEAANELNAKVDLFASSTIFSSYLVTPTSTPAMVINSSGNVGIGTTTPNYKLQVMGDIAATAFINTSTKTAKKDIAYLSSSQEEDFLGKIKNTSLANYHYNIENENNPLRLGLIAEEAPSEILSVDGKGVDVYKMATFTLGGVKALQKEIEKMKIDLAALSANSSASSGTGSDGLFAWITEKFKTVLGIGFEQGKLCLEDVCVNKAQLKELLDKNNISQTSSSSSSSEPTSDVGSSSSSSLPAGESGSSSSSSSTESSSSSSSETLSSSSSEASSSSSSSAESSST